MAKKKNKGLRVVLPVLSSLVLGVVAYKAITLSSSIDNVKFDFLRVDYKGINSFNLRLDTFVNFVSQGKKSFTIESLILDMVLPTGVTIAQIRLPQLNKVIKGKEITTLKLPTQTHLLSAGLDLAVEIINLLTTGKFPDYINVKGTARVNGLLVPIDEKIQLNDNANIAGLGSLYIQNTFNEAQKKELEEMYSDAKNKGYTEEITGNATRGDEIAFVEAVFAGTYPRSRFSHFEMIFGEIVKDSYGKAKQQHTFTIETPYGNIRRKGRNIYKYATLAKKRDEGERKKDLAEKYKRGEKAREERRLRLDAKDNPILFD